MANNKKKDDDHSPGIMSGTIVILGLIVWIVLGVLAFIFSILCMNCNRQGSFGVKVGGLLMALLLGPFYWIYYPIARASGDYCKKIPAGIRASRLPPGARAQFQK